MNWQLIAGIALGFIAMVCFAIGFEEECPRRVLGYRCHGIECDHSRETLSKAYQIVRKNYWRR